MLHTEEELKSLLSLTPHPREGGFFARAFRSERKLNDKDKDTGRVLMGSIYYMVTADSPSRMHRLSVDEVFHFYLGNPVKLIKLDASGQGTILTLGQDLKSGQLLQAVVPAGTWQGLELADGGQFALMGTTTAPGFEWDDFELGDRDSLINKYVNFRDFITRLT